MRCAGWGRLAKAACIVLFLLGSIPLVDGLLESLRGEGSGSPAVPVRLPQDGGRTGDDPFAMLDAVEQQMAATEVSPDASSLLQAVAVLPEARDLRADASGCTASYVVEGREDEVLGALGEAMGRRGWSSVPLGDVAGMAFFDGDGESLVATCTQVGDGVSIVFRRGSP